MSFDDPWLRDGTPSPLDYERRLYAQTQNPIHVVRGYQICSEFTRGADGSIMLPDWIRAYLDHFASTIQDLFGEQVEDTRPAPNLGSTLADALGFKRLGRGVRTDAFTDWTHNDRNMSLASAVWRHQRDNPSASIEASVFEIAERNKVGEKIVWEAWSVWRVFLDKQRAVWA